MKGTISKYTAESTSPTPCSGWCDGNWTSNVVFVIVYIESKWSIKELGERS